MGTTVKHIALINVGTDEHVSSISNDGSFPALGVVALGTVLEADHPDIRLTVVDGQIVDMTRLERMILGERPDLVGLSVLGSTYGNSLKLAAIAKSIGAITVFGNDHAAVLARRILGRQADVDYIIGADIGEFAFSQFVSFLKGEVPLNSVPGLYYRMDGDVMYNASLEFIDGPIRGGLQQYVLDRVPIPNRRLLSNEHWDSYLDTYLARYGGLHADDVTGVTTMNRARGCARVKVPCTFCGIQDLGLRFSSAEMFWRDVRAGIKDVSASIFYEAFDSFSSAPRWVAEVAAAKPADIGNPKFFVYTQAAETNARIIDLYKEIGVYRVNMGLESGDTQMLKRLKGPHDSLERNQEACILFKEAGMQIYGSLVLGGPGESYRSLHNTVEFAKWLIDCEMMAALEAQPIYPDPAARTGSWMFEPSMAHADSRRMDFEILDKAYLEAMPAKYGASDCIDFDEISIDFNRIFCSVSWDDLLAATREITDYAAKAGMAYGSARMSNR